MPARVRRSISKRISAGSGTSSSTKPPRSSAIWPGNRAARAPSTAIRIDYPDDLQRIPNCRRPLFSETQPSSVAWRVSTGDPSSSSATRKPRHEDQDRRFRHVPPRGLPQALRLMNGRALAAVRPPSIRPAPIGCRRRGARPGEAIAQPHGDVGAACRSSAGDRRQLRWRSGDRRRRPRSCCSTRRIR